MKSETYAVQDGKWPLIVARPVNYTYARAPDAQQGLPRIERLGRQNAAPIATGVWPWMWGARYTLDEEPYEFKYDAADTRPWRLNNLNTYLMTPMDKVRRNMSIPGFGCRPDGLFVWFKEGALCGLKCDPTEGGATRGAAPPLTYVDLDVATGDDTMSVYRGTLAHELGHIIGEFDDDYSVGLDEVGWDPWLWLEQDGATTMARPWWDIEHFFNVMNQGIPSNRTWIEPETYLDMMAELSSPRKERFGIGECSKQATILMDLKHTELPPGWSIGPAIELDTHNGPVIPGNQGRLTVRLLDGQGADLYATSFDLAEYTGRDEERWLFEAPALHDTQTIELYWDGHLETSRMRSVNAPLVTIQSPQPGETLDENTVVSWSATDADGDALLATVLYSHDNGTSFVPLAVMTTSTEAPFVVAGKPSASNGRIIVKVTDGLNTTQVEVPDLHFGANNAPSVDIYMPHDGSTYRAGANVPLHGSAYDAEDGWLSEASLVWISDRDGQLGTGKGLNVVLTPGTHLITLRAMDFEQAIGEAALTVQVQ